mmetsp:Transcript_80862/g.187748  ORF Transcript_80862/g.187748 Transcript_80862/m.187748 type:complete len:278 (-) Transcript_80862:759-1592(-)
MHALRPVRLEGRAVAVAVRLPFVPFVDHGEIDVGAVDITLRDFARLKVEPPLVQPRPHFASLVARILSPVLAHEAIDIIKVVGKAHVSGEAPSQYDVIPILKGAEDVEHVSVLNFKPLLNVRAKARHKSNASHGVLLEDGHTLASEQARRVDGQGEVQDQRPLCGDGNIVHQCQAVGAGNTGPVLEDAVGAHHASVHSFCTSLRLEEGVGGKDELPRRWVNTWVCCKRWKFLLAAKSVRANGAEILKRHFSRHSCALSEAQQTSTVVNDARVRNVPC